MSDIFNDFFARGRKCAAAVSSQSNGNFVDPLDCHDFDDLIQDACFQPSETSEDPLNCSDFDDLISECVWTEVQDEKICPSYVDLDLVLDDVADDYYSNCGDNLETIVPRAAVAGYVAHVCDAKIDSKPCDPVAVTSEINPVIKLYVDNMDNYGRHRMERFPRRKLDGVFYPNPGELGLTISIFDEVDIAHYAWYVSPGVIIKKLLDGHFGRRVRDPWPRHSLGNYGVYRDNNVLKEFCTEFYRDYRFYGFDAYYRMLGKIHNILMRRPTLTSDSKYLSLCGYRYYAIYGVPISPYDIVWLRQNSIWLYNRRSYYVLFKFFVTWSLNCNAVALRSRLRCSRLVKRLAPCHREFIQ